MKTLRISYMLVGLLLIFLPQNSGPKVQLWFAGPLHADEIVGKSGESWYGLYDLPNGFVLRKSIITVKDSSTAMGAHDKYVSVDQPGESLFLIRGLSTLQEGPVKTVYSGNGYLSPGQELSLKLSPTNYYSLTASGKTSGEIVQDYTIRLFSNQKSQTLVSYPTMYLESETRIVWAGDLDGDGKLDLLLDTYSYNGKNYVLFLSTLAAKGDCVKRVASFSVKGC